MKPYSKFSIMWVAVLVAAFLFKACETESQDIPTPSTQANFEYIHEIITDPDTGSLSHRVTFTSTSVLAQGYLWDFGNGDTSTEENPVYTYNEDGIYEVTLTVTPEPEQAGLHYNVLENTQRLVLVPTIFFEGFDDDGLAESFPPEGWMLKDVDGDGHNWYWGTFEGEYYILSDSWLQSTGEALTPDNWIITPQIDLTEISSVSLEFDVTPRASGPAFRTETYSVLVSTTGTEIEDFEAIYTETISEDHENWVWQLRNLDLSDFAGENIYVAFRHHDSEDLWSVALTNIHVFQDGN